MELDEYERIRPTLASGVQRNDATFALPRAVPSFPE
jgi:hypothetical protein